jgi:hypothetical protein
MALGINDFDAGNIGPLEGVGPQNGFSRIKIITSRAIKTTGSFIVNFTPLSCL